MEDIEELVSKARAYIGTRSDNRKWCSINQIKAFLEAGAIPIEINEKQDEENYSHEVSYKRIIFVNFTAEPVPELKKYEIK